jgi:hypothetical protein
MNLVKQLEDYQLQELAEMVAVVVVVLVVLVAAVKPCLVLVVQH